MKNAKKASEIIRESWDWHGKKTQEFIINGKKIKTNLCAEWSYYDGMGAPEKYSCEMGGTYFKTRKSSGETLDDLIAQGFDEIRFMLYASKMIRGYCEVYVFASNSTKAKERRAKERAQREAEKLEQAKAELQSNLSAHLKALDDERTAEADQAKAERIHDQILEKAQESNSEAQESKNAWEISVFFSKDQILRELNQLKTDLGSGDIVGCTKRNEHQRNRYIKALEIAIIQLMASEKPLMPHLDAGKEIIKEISTEATGSNLEAQKATSAVEFEKISDYEIKASWKGEMIGKITISYKSYSPVSKIYRVNGNIDEKFEFLDDAKMHLIQNFRAQAHEYLKQLERNSASATAVVDLRNKIDALDDQIAELFIKGAEMKAQDDQLASLKAKREQLAKKQHHILERYGNNQESQSIFKEITEIDSQIKKIEFKNGAVVRIVDLDSANYGEWGIIEKFDGYFYYLAMHGDHEHAPMIIKEKQIELASGKEAE